MKEYKADLNNFFTYLESINIEIDQFSEFKFESLCECSLKGTEQELIDWYEYFVRNSKMKMEEIPLEECREWSIDQDSGSIRHSSGEFFSVEGIRITGSISREVNSGWDQPFLKQVGNDGGILGLVRQRFKGVPHYLIEAKEEPGNYNVVQISPTVQATYSNLKQAHKGKKTSYSELFLQPEKYPLKVILDQWTSEDGGRLFNKRNRSMLVEYDEFSKLELISKRFKWVSLFQLKKLIRDQNAIVAPHIRGIISGL